MGDTFRVMMVVCAVAVMLLILAPLWIPLVFAWIGLVAFLSQ